MTTPNKPTTAADHRRGAFSLALMLTVAWVIATHVRKIPGLDLVHIGRIDWLLHGTGYAVMGACWSLTLCLSGRVRPRRAALIAGLAMAALGVADELTQPPFGRTAELRDWIADLVGTTISVTLTTYVYSRPTRRARRSTQRPQTPTDQPS